MAAGGEALSSSRIWPRRLISGARILINWMCISPLAVRFQKAVVDHNNGRSLNSHHHLLLPQFRFSKIFGFFDQIKLIAYNCHKGDILTLYRGFCSSYMHQKICFIQDGPTKSIPFQGFNFRVLLLLLLTNSI